MAAAEQRIDVFVSYSHADAAWLKRVQVHLKPLVRDEQIDLWDDTRIQAGARWREEIRAALARAQVAALLISADFFSSDFIATKEVPPPLEAERKRGLVILGVHLSASRFDRDRSQPKANQLKVRTSRLSARRVRRGEILVACS
jgi:hypothetical protein